MFKEIKLMMLFLLLIPQQGLTITTSLIEQMPLGEVGNIQTMVLDEAVLYIKIEDDTEVVWSYNRKTGIKRSLFNAVSGEVEWVGKSNGMVIFTQDSACCEKLWRTDGTPAGTQAIELGTSDIQTSFQGPWLIGSYEDDQVFRTNGYQVTSFSVEAPYLDSTCVFDNGDFIFRTAKASKSRLMRVTGTVISEINNQFNEGDDAGIFYDLNLQNNICFIKQLIHPSRVILYATNQAGAVVPIEIQNNTYDQIREIKYDPSDHSYYVLLADEYQNDFRAGVFRINIITGEVLNSYEVEDPRFALYGLSVLQDFVVMRFGTPHESPEIPKIQFLDKNLSLLTDTPFEEITGLIINRWRDKDLLLFMPWYYAETGAFYTVESGSISSSATFSGFRGYVLDVSVNEQHAYLSGRVQSSSEFVIHELLADLDIGTYTAGMWFDESRQNQGISINHGRRTDQSEYLFITVYTYDNGLPMWFAAMTEIEPNMQSVVVPLFRFSGLNMWQQNLPAEQLQIGTLAFKHQGCDQLDVIFTVAGSSQSFTVRRMGNIAFRSQCQD